jgi:hypothetical protein
MQVTPMNAYCSTGEGDAVVTFATGLIMVFLRVRGKEPAG